MEKAKSKDVTMEDLTLYTVYTRNLYNFINQCYPNKFNENKKAIQQQVGKWDI